MNSFYMNGYLWRVLFVNPDNPMLVDRTNTLRVATTDPTSNCIYISNALSGSLRMRVLVHELGHCAIFSFHLLPAIHRMVRTEFWIEAEEWICNFIADYGMTIFEAAYDILGDDAIFVVPQELERLIA